MNIGFIGAGNMGFAIMSAIAGSSLAGDINLFSFDVSGSKDGLLKDLGVNICGSSKELVKCCKYVFLAVKPQIIDAVLDEIDGEINEDTVLVSVAAGITGGYIRSKTNENTKVILAMPNTPLLIGEGAVALARTNTVSEEEFKAVMDVFAASSVVIELPEDKMKHIIAVNSSSPAFIYLFAKGFTDYASEAGIPENTAKALFCQTLIGSAKMILESGFEIDELIKMVTSPGGTTLAGLEKLYEGDFLSVVKNACNACTERAFELSK